MGGGAGGGRRRHRSPSRVRPGSAPKGATRPSGLRRAQHTRPRPARKGPGGTAASRAGHGGEAPNPQPGAAARRAARPGSEARCHGRGGAITREDEGPAGEGPGATLHPVPDRPCSQSPLSVEGAAAGSQALPATGAFRRGPSGWLLGGGGMTGGQHPALSASVAVRVPSSWGVLTSQRPADLHLSLRSI